MNTIAGEALQNSLHIAATINVDQGTRIMIFVRRDLDFSSLYPDPVGEMVKALKRDRVRASSDGEVGGARRPLVGKD
jgi:type IV secretion system protein VirB10